jgi:hypothetical protein
MCTRLVGALQPGDEASVQPADGALPQGILIGISQWDFEESLKTCRKQTYTTDVQLLWQSQLISPGICAPMCANSPASC